MKTRLQKAKKVVKLIDDIDYLSNWLSECDEAGTDYNNHVKMVNNHRKAIIELHELRINKLLTEIKTKR